MNILHKIKCKIYRFLLKNGMLSPKVVLLMDGGPICAPGTLLKCFKLIGISS